MRNKTIYALYREGRLPVHDAPKWVSEVIMGMDEGTEAGRPRVIERIAVLAPHLHRLSAEAEWRAAALAARETMRLMPDPDVLRTCEQIAVLFDARGRGEVVSDDEIKSAQEAAVEAMQIARAVREMTIAMSAGRAANKAAHDRLTNAILTDWERELVAAQR